MRDNAGDPMPFCSAGQYLVDSGFCRGVCLRFRMADLKLWRRHRESCPRRAVGRIAHDCNCPIWVEGRDKGKRIVHSMQTRNWDRAQRKLDRMLDPDAPPPQVEVQDA